MHEDFGPEDFVNKTRCLLVKTAGRLLENSCDILVDLRSRKAVEKNIRLCCDVFNCFRLMYCKTALKAITYRDILI